jgi:hypothetical protein
VRICLTYLVEAIRMGKENVYQISRKVLGSYLEKQFCFFCHRNYFLSRNKLKSETFVVLESLDFLLDLEHFHIGLQQKFS